MQSTKKLAKPFSIDKLDVTKTYRKDKLDSNALLKIVTELPKKNIQSAKDIPAGKVTWAPISSIMEKPRSQDPNYSNHDWHHQLTSAYIVHTPNGFVGDNVIFDRENYYSFNQRWLGSGWELYRNTEKIVREDNWVISIAAWGGEAFQHFLIDVMPKLAATIDLLESPEYQHIKIASHIKQCPVAQWLWKKLDLGHRVIQKPLNAQEGFVISTDMAMYPSFYPNHHIFGLYPRHTLLPLQKRLGILDAHQNDLIIYLPRSGFRQVTNEDQVLTRLLQICSGTPYSVNVFKPSGNFDMDMNIMSKAKLILGPHGGAFANLAFAKPGTQVIEFLPAYKLLDDINTAERNYWGMSQAAGLDYWTFEPDEFQFNGPMTINCDKLEELIRQVL